MNEVEKFIAMFRGDTEPRISDKIRDKVIDLTINKYVNGYCYYFAKILQAAFQRGDVVILAPYGHFMWRDCDGEMYDIRGKYDGSHHTDYEVEIEEKYLGDHLKNFLWREGYVCDTTKEDIDQLIEEAKARNRNKSGMHPDEIVQLYANVLEQLRNSGQYYSEAYINLYIEDNKLAATTLEVVFAEDIHPNVNAKAVEMCNEFYRPCRSSSIDFSYFMTEGGQPLTHLEGSLDGISWIDEKYREQKISIFIELIDNMTEYNLDNYDCSVIAFENGRESEIPNGFKEEVTEILFPLDTKVGMEWK